MTSPSNCDTCNKEFISDEFNVCPECLEHEHGPNWMEIVREPEYNDSEKWVQDSDIFVPEYYTKFLPFISNDYKKLKAKKAQFFKLNGFNSDYKKCDKELLLNWIKQTHNIE